MTAKEITRTITNTLVVPFYSFFSILIFSCSYTDRAKSPADIYYRLKNYYSDMNQYQLNREIYTVTDLKGKDAQSLSKKITKFISAFKKTLNIECESSTLTIVAFNKTDDYYDYIHDKRTENIHTPYGLYITSDRMIVVNLKAGDGTITHELSHSIIDDDFPNAPIWLNEGISSLYEECIITGEKVVGSINWRFKNAENLFKSNNNLIIQLVTADSNQFYNENPDRAYSLARLFCFYLQDKKLLKPLYHSIKNVKGSTEELKVIKQLFGEDLKSIDMSFKDWLSKQSEGAGD